MALEGYGIDLRNPDQIKPRVADIDFSQPAIYAGDGSANFTIFFSQQQLDLVRQFSLNSSLSVKNVVAGGHVGLSYVDNTHYSGNDLNFAFVCTRDYGTTTFTNAHVGAQFSEEVSFLRESNHLSGLDLSAAISERFGTHYIVGHRSVARVVVIYAFHFDSTSTMNDIIANINGRYAGGVTTVEFYTDVRNFFAQTASHVSMTYQFYTSDPSRPLLFSTNAITSYSDFLAFSDAVVNYCNAQMTPSGALRSEFVVDRIENLSGYCALVGNCVPAPLPTADYDRWLDAYGTLARWDKTLTTWAADFHQMSWMNDNGQRLVINIRQDVANYRRALEIAARSHFESSAPLTVPDDIFNYFANFSRIPIPRVNIIESDAVGGNAVSLIGYVTSGPIGLTLEHPFNQVVFLRNGAEFGSYSPLFDSQDAMANDFIRAYTSSPFPFLTTKMEALTNSAQWQVLRDASTNCRLSFFYTSSPDPYDDSIAIKDAAGNVVDSLNELAARNDPCPQSLQASAHVGLVSSASVPHTSVAGTSAAVTISVTNEGPGAAYGISLTLPLDTNRFEFFSIGGSQGAGSFADGQLTYDVGPLANGAVATIQLGAVPLATGQVSFGDPGQVALGEDLIDQNPASKTVVLGPLTVSAPSLSILRVGGRFELNWLSDTDRLVLEHTENPGATWTQITNSVPATGSQHRVTLGVLGGGGYFRLHGF